MTRFKMKFPRYGVSFLVLCLLTGYLVLLSGPAAAQSASADTNEGNASSSGKRKTGDTFGGSEQDFPLYKISIKLMIFPSVEFADCDVKSAVDILSEKIKEADTDQTGVRVKIIGLDREEVRNKRVTFRLQNIPLYDAVRYLCLQSGLKFRIISKRRMIVIGPEDKLAKFGLANKRGAEAIRLIGVTRDRSKQDIEKKLKRIIVPKMDYEDTALRSVLDDLSRSSKELDPDKRGVGFVPVLNGSKKNWIDYLKVDYVTLLQGISLICEAGDVKYYVEPHAVLIIDNDISPVCELKESAEGKKVQSESGVRNKKGKGRRRKNP